MQSKPEQFITLPLVNGKEENICLPLVINAVLKYWGEEIPSEETIEAAKKYPKIKGPVMMEGIELAERHGFVSYIYKSSIGDLKKRIAQGIPPIVIVPGIHETVQHATIICGYNSEERRILTYVPEPDTIGAIPEAKFEQNWQEDDMTTIILVPTDMKDPFENENLKFKESNRICFEAEKLRLQNKTDLAREKIRKAVELDKENPQAWCLLAGVYNELNLEEAIPYYERAIKLNPRYYLAYRGLGNYYLKNKSYFLAELHYTKAVEINPNRFGPIYKNRALARLELNNNSGAKEDLIKYLQQTPGALDKDSIEDAIRQL